MQSSYYHNKMTLHAEMQIEAVDPSHLNSIVQMQFILTSKKRCFTPIKYYTLLKLFVNIL